MKSTTSSLSSQGLEDLGENDNNIDINNQSSDNIVIHAQLVSSITSDNLCVIDQIESIDCDTEHVIESVNFFISRIDSINKDKSSSEQSPSKDKEDSTTGGEISLSCASIKS